MPRDRSALAARRPDKREILTFAARAAGARFDLPAPAARGADAFLSAGGQETELGASPEQTVTVDDLYTSSFLTISSFLKVICAILSFFFEYETLRKQDRVNIR